MKKYYSITGGALLSSTILLAGCGSESNPTSATEEGEDSIQIVATIAQIADPLEIIGGEHVSVKALMGPGVDPHLYEATQSDIGTLQEADLIFYSGLHLEANMMDVFSNTSVPSTAIAEAIPWKIC